MTTTQAHVPSAPTTEPVHHSRTRILAGVSAPAGLAVALGLVMPRGPLTSLQSLTALTLACAVGLAAGWLLRSRWAALIAPTVFAVAFEITRLGQTGPTVEAIRFDRGIWGAIVFISGRGFDALIILAPMAIAALWGAARARRAHTTEARRGFWAGARLITLTAATLGIVALVVLLARPASTPPILAADGTPLAGSISELTTVEIDGHDQALLLRGRNANAPVLLFLEGGPGGTALGAMHHSGAGLEQHFVVATWDQRGTGKSLTARDPVATLTPEQAVSDTIEVAEYLRACFDKQGIYLVGSSWGTTLGVLAAQARPDLFAAYVGSGQMVDQQQTDLLMYADSLAYAQRVGDQGFEQRLRTIGQPPYTDTLAYPIALSSNPEWDAYTRGQDYSFRASYPSSLFTSEYTFTESMRAMGAIADTFAAMYPHLQDIDFRRDVPRLDVPIILVQGAHEAPGRAGLAEEWFAQLDAPSKRLIHFANAGHTPHLDEPGHFADVMAEVAQTTEADGHTEGS